MFHGGLVALVPIVSIVPLVSMVPEITVLSKVPNNTIPTVSKTFIISKMLMILKVPMVPKVLVAPRVTKVLIMAHRAWGTLMLMMPEWHGVAPTGSSGPSIHICETCNSEVAAMESSRRCGMRRSHQATVCT